MPNNFRIAYCLPQVLPLNQATSGGLTQQAYIIKGLQARGHQLTFITLDGPRKVICTQDLNVPSTAAATWSDKPWFAFTSKILWRIQRFLHIPFLNVFSNLRLFDACLQNLPGHDIVHERNGLFRVGVALASKYLKLPYVLFFDADPIFEMDFLGKSLKGVLRYHAKNMMRYTLAAANHIICVSEPAKDNLVSKWHTPEQKITVIPNGVDVQLFRPRLNERAQDHASFGLGSGPCIIFVGSFYLWHDVATLLDAFVQTLVRYPRASLLLVGDGEQRAVMEQYAIRLGVHDNVSFTGRLPQTQVAHLIASADVAVAPYPRSNYAFWGSPMKLFEYMATGTPVVASAVGQLVEIIQDGTNGLLVQPGDSSALAVALIELLDNSSLRLKLGQQARQDCLDKYSWEHYFLRLERIYDMLVMKRLRGVHERQ